MGIEPTLVAWEATVLPLNYTRLGRAIVRKFRKDRQQGGVQLSLAAFRGGRRRAKSFEAALSAGLVHNPWGLTAKASIDPRIAKILTSR
jgi:hypothetical protein